jgi:hypothetical protein
MKKSVLTVLIIFLSLGYCFSQCYDKNAKKIANVCAYMVVNKAWQGGNDISAKVENCSYDNDTGKWTMGVIIEFYGQLTGDYYRSDGDLKYNEYTQQFTFYPRYKNKNLEGYEAFMGILVTGAIIYSLSKD